MLGLGYCVICVAQFHFESVRLTQWFQMLKEAIDLQSRIRGKDVFASCEDVFDEVCGDDAESYFAINTAEREVVDSAAERRNVSTLGRINLDSEYIFTIEVKVRRQLEGKRCVAPFVFPETYAVEPNGGRGHDTFKIDKNVLATSFARKSEAAPVKRHELKRLFVKSMPR